MCSGSIVLISVCCALRVCCLSTVSVCAFSHYSHLTSYGYFQVFSFCFTIDHSALAPKDTSGFMGSCYLSFTFSPIEKRLMPAQKKRHKTLALASVSPTSHPIPRGATLEAHIKSVSPHRKKMLQTSAKKKSKGVETFKRHKN